MNLIILIAYLAGITIVGILAGRHVSDIRDFAVAGKNYGAWIIFATLSASFIGGGFSIGNSEHVFNLGVVNIVCLWGFSLQILLVSVFIAPRMDRYQDAITTGDIIGKHYGKLAKVLTGGLSVILCAGILGAQVSAMGYIFNVFTGLPRLWGILIGCSIVILYSTLGGMKAVVASDIFQFIVLAVGIPLTLVFSVMYAGGVHEVLSHVPASHFQIVTEEFPWTAFISLFLTFLVGETLVPPYVQRLLISSDAKKTARGTFYSGVFSVPFFMITGLIGLVALAIKPSLDANLAMPYIVKTTLPVGVGGVIIAAMISIIMSSADSFLNSASVAIVNDVLMTIKTGSYDDKKLLRIAQTTNLAVGVLAVVFALSIKGVLDILIYSYNFWAPVILIPLVSAILGLRVKFSNFVAGIVGGMVSYVLSVTYLSSIVEVDGIVFGVTGNVVCFYGLYVIQNFGRIRTRLMGRHSSMGEKGVALEPVEKDEPE